MKYTDPDGRSPELWRIFFTPDSNSSERVIRHEVRKDEVKFAQTFEVLQKNIEKGMIIGARFMADNGTVISMACYATGHAELGILIDGISVGCDISVAIYDYSYSEKTASDKTKLIADLSTTILSTFAGDKLGKGLEKRLAKLGKEKFAKKLSDCLSTFISSEFDSVIDDFVDYLINHIETQNQSQE